MEPINIAYDAKRLFLNQTGLGNYSRNLVSGLAKFHPENTYHLFTPRIGDLYQQFRKDFPVHQPDALWKLMPSAVWRTFGFRSLVKKLNIDIFHGLSHELPFGIKKKSCKLIVSMHDLIFKHYPAHYPAMDRFFYDKKIKQSLKVADTVVCISQQTAVDLQEFYTLNPEKIKVIYQSCGEAFETFEKNENRNTELRKKYQLPSAFLLSVGMNSRKNLEILLDALHLLKHNGTACPLVLVGNKNAYQSKLRQKAAKLKLDELVLFPENVSNEELPSFYDMALATVYPSVYEGFGIPIIESLMCKTPVITNKEGCFSEAAGPGALYVDVNAADEIADAMSQLLYNSQLREEKTEKGFAYVQKFRAENTSADWMALYKQLIKI